MTLVGRSARAIAAKISVSLPPEVLETAERECRREGESRSELVRRALQGLIDRTREELQLAAYVAGYIAEPETDDEAHAVSEAAQPILEGSDWD